MKLRRTVYFMMVALVAITLTGFAATAEPVHNLNLSDTQIYKIQALLLAQSQEIRTLSANVLAAQETLSAAVAKADPVSTAMAVLSLDAAEKALKNTQQANQKNVMALLNDSQKQVVTDYSHKSIPASD